MYCLISFRVTSQLWVTFVEALYHTELNVFLYFRMGRDWVACLAVTPVMRMRMCVRDCTTTQVSGRSDE